MQIVIEIDEEEYKSCLPYRNADSTCNIITKAVANGTPLPEGHGRLIDADELLKIINEGYYNDYINQKVYSVGRKEVENAPTILVADKEVADDT